MKQEFCNLEINTNGISLYEITDQVIKWIKSNKFNNGFINLSIQHTSASLIVQENADPDVQIDLIKHFNKLAPMDDQLYIHTTEGKDDMPAHIKASLLGASIQIPISNGKLNLGIWQGVYLCEHRNNGGSRGLVITAFGD